MTEPPFEVRLELAGWCLVWERVQTRETDPRVAATLREEASVLARRRWADRPLAEHPRIAAVRRLFREAGTDPTRYRPSSEALLRRLLKGEELPAIHPLVDLNNSLSVILGAPCCVTAEGSWSPPVTLRRGLPGEVMESMRGPFKLENKPLLTDPEGPFGTPITDSERVKLRPSHHRGWMVVYLPASEAGPEEVAAALAELQDAAPWLQLEPTGGPGGG